MLAFNWVPPPDQFVGPASKVLYRLKGGEEAPPPGRLTLIKCPRTTARCERHSLRCSNLHSFLSLRRRSSAPCPAARDPQVVR
jgi:hypothetical protein